MMLSGDIFFSTVSRHFQSELPFVLYKYPGDGSINALLQSNSELHILDSMEQRGFIMAPFKKGEDVVLIPQKFSKHMTCDIATLRRDSIKRELQLDSINRQAHLTIVEKGVQAIKRGAFEKVVLSREQRIKLPDLDCLEFYKNLALNYPDAFCYIWYHPKVGLWMGASPETLIEVCDQKLRTMALAATIGDRGQEIVHWGEKEKQEQSLVTVAILDALKDYCTQIEVAELQTVKAAKLYHLQTKISAILNGDLGSLIHELHPTPAVCGLPKLEAARFIEENECYNRSYYTGYLGTINIEQQAKLFVNLRCMQYFENELILYVGGGITSDSIPTLEWDETVNKGKTILDVITSEP